MASLPLALRYRPYNEDDGLGDGTFELVMAAYKFRSITMQPVPIDQMGIISYFDLSNAYAVTPIWMLQKLTQLVLTTMRDPAFHDSDSMCSPTAVDKYQIKLEPMIERCVVKTVIIAHEMFLSNVVMIVLRLEARSNINGVSKEGAVIAARVNDIAFGQMRLKHGFVNPTSTMVETLHQNLVRGGGISFWDDGTQSGYCEDLYIKGTEKHARACRTLHELNELLNKHRKVVLLKYPAVEDRDLIEEGTYPPRTNESENGICEENGTESG